MLAALRTAMTRIRAERRTTMHDHLVRHFLDSPRDASLPPGIAVGPGSVTGAGVPSGFRSGLRSSAGLALLALGLLAAPACGDVRLPADPPDGGSTIPPPPVAPEDLSLADSFEITAELTYMDSTFPVPPDFLPDRHQFVLRLDDADDTTQGIAGAAGQVVAPSFFHLAGGQRVLERDFFLAAADGSAVLCGVGAMHYETMTLETFDTDGDGSVDLVQGTATGSVAGLDIFDAGRFTAAIQGTLDTTPPRLTVRGPSIDQPDQSVLGGFVVEASEPLPAGARVFLTSEIDGARIDLLPFPEDQPAVIAFVLPSDVLLPFGATMRLEVVPGIEDLAGNAGTLDTPSIATIGDPQLFEQDGFEAGAHVTLSGDASLVASVDSVPAITGDTSLLLEPGGSATLRIPLPDSGGSEQTLGLQLRGLFRGRNDAFVDGDVVLVLADTGERIQAPFPEALNTAQTGDQRWRYVGPVTPLDVTLPPGATGELLVVLRVAAPALCGEDSAPESAVLIDDVALFVGIGPQPTGARPGP
jgi:hypothetical protein